MRRACTVLARFFGDEIPISLGPRRIALFRNFRVGMRNFGDVACFNDSIPESTLPQEDDGATGTSTVGTLGTPAWSPPEVRPPPRSVSSARAPTIRSVECSSPHY